MSVEEFDQDELSSTFWHPALRYLHAMLLISKRRPEEEINVGRRKIKRQELISEIWEIAQIMCYGGIGIGGEIEDPMVKESFNPEKTPIDLKADDKITAIYQLVAYLRKKA